MRHPSTFLLQCQLRCLRARAFHPRATPQVQFVHTFLQYLRKAIVAVNGEVALIYNLVNKFNNGEADGDAVELVFVAF